MPKQEFKHWKLSEEGEKIFEHTRKVLEERQKGIETMMPPCPIDGLQGTYYKSVGAGLTGRVSVQYKCPNNDVFGWDFNGNLGYLISAQGSTPREAK